MQHYRTISLFIVLVLLTAACGARYDEDERQLLIGELGDQGRALAQASPGAGDGGAAGQGTGGGTASSGGGASVPGGGSGDGAAAGGQGPASGAGSTSGSTSSDEGSGTAGGGGATGEGGQSAGGGGQDQSSGGGQPADTRAAPPGGNGGSTDVGVTADTITISNVSDISGAVPGLFAPSQKAVNAYIQKFLSEEGTVYGRTIELVNRDSKIDANENRRQYLAACEDSFAVVGSMSAFDEGVAQPVEGCGIPDLRTAAVNPTTMGVDGVVSVDAMDPSVQPVAEYEYWRDQYPEAVTKAGAVFINADTTQKQTQLVIDGTTKIGYDWIKKIPVELTETNYAPVVIELKDAGVEFVYFQGAYQQAVRLAETMQQQQYEPTVYALQSNAYTPDMIASGGEAVQGIHVGVPSALVEEIDQHPELQEYDRWLKQIDPNARPTSLGMYSWAAAKLFVQALKEIGPEPTRQKLFDYLSGVHDYDAGGLIPPQDIGNQTPTDCGVIIEVVGDRFERVAPSEPGTYKCSSNGPVPVG